VSGTVWVRRGVAGRGSAGQGTSGRGNARQGRLGASSVQSKLIERSASPGEARRGAARLGAARSGKASQGHFGAEMETAKVNAYNFQIVGVTALLMHNNNIEERDRIEALRKRMKGGKPGDDRSPPESWKGYLYISDETGNVCIPAESLLSCLLGGGTKVKVGGKETLKTHSQRVMFDRLDYDLMVGDRTVAKKDIDAISGEFVEHKQAALELGFRLHVKPCTVGTSKHVRVRPMFSQWALSGSFEIEDEDATVLGLTPLRDLFNACGRLVGLGDWRPSSPKRPGQYGRFTATVERL